MMQRIFGNNDIANVYGGIQRAGNSGIDDMGHMENIRKYLYAHSGIDFSDTAAHNNYFFAVQITFVEFHGGFFFNFIYLHV